MYVNMVYFVQDSRAGRMRLVTVSPFLGSRSVFQGTLSQPQPPGVPNLRFQIIPNAGGRIFSPPSSIAVIQLLVLHFALLSLSRPRRRPPTVLLALRPPAYRRSFGLACVDSTGNTSEQLFRASFIIHSSFARIITSYYPRPGDSKLNRKQRHCLHWDYRRLSIPGLETIIYKRPAILNMAF